VDSEEKSANDPDSSSDQPCQQWQPAIEAAQDANSCSGIANLSMSNYRTLVESLPICLLIKDTESRRLYANPAYLRYRKTTAEQLLGKSDYDLFSREIADRYRQDDLKVIESGKSLHGVEKTQSASGKTHWVERFKCPLRDDQGNICGVQLLFWDVTARIRAEHLRDQERQWLQTLLDNMPDSIYFKDSESRFIRVGAGMAKKFGLPNSDAVIGLTDADIFTPEHAKAARDNELEIMHTGIPVINRIERETWPDRKDSWCTSTKLPLKDASGQIIGTFGISRDITSIKKTQDELAAARDAADAANRAKSDFLANMSHEIRTPMNAIIGMSELLSQTRLTREQHDFLDLVREAADSLLRLLNDILDFSKIEASKLELERIPLSLRDTVGKTGQTLSLRAAEKGLELICRIAPDIPDRLIGDPGRLRQILINLIGNAIKFTDSGEILVDVCRDNEPNLVDGDKAHERPTPKDNTLRLRFSVRDTGIGIAEDKRDSVLAAFTQADSSTTRRYGGTGLGLTISAQLAKLMGGRLWLESEVGVGTTFYFTAELAIADQQCLVETGALRTLSDLAVLVVDDNATNRRILQEVFSAWRLRPTLVASGPEAIMELDRAAAAGAPYRLAVLDCMMPDMDGFELSRHIRQKYNAEQLRLIILSSAAGVGDSDQCQQVGIARYLTKPVIQSELLDAVLQVMRVVQVAEPQNIAAVPAGPKLKILLAEDGLANQVVARGLLHAAGHEVVIAADGRETIERWAAEPFDLILMDMHMPELDGIEATREIRRIEQQQGRKPIPIIAVTAAAMSEDTRMCLDAGMNAFLAKPLQAHVLYKAIADFAKPHQDEPHADAFTDVMSLSDLNVEQSESLDQSSTVSVVDIDEAIKRMPGGKAAVRQLAVVFLAECKSLINDLEQSINANDAATVQRLAHTLKGSAKLFVADQLVNSALQLELAAANRKNEQFADLLAELRRDEAVVRAEIESFLASN
jgi:PAS domain S-box-containing protein